MYNFTYKKFAKLLNDSVKRGVRVTVILDKKKALEEKKTQYDYLVKNGIDVILLENKLHIKMAIIDKKSVIFGSANWKKKSFKSDYEILYISDDKKMLSRFNHIFKELLQEYK
jgi:phosphatidylserine/phosphatidylglycerophosphate/cardiolipin synthase-like enzyme